MQSTSLVQTIKALDEPAVREGGLTVPIITEPCELVSVTTVSPGTETGTEDVD